MSNKSLIKDLLEGKKNCCHEAAVVIADQDKEIVELIEERDALRESYQLAADTAGYKGDWFDAAPIRALKDINMSLCRDLDEAQKTYENAIGIE